MARTFYMDLKISMKAEAFERHLPTWDRLASDWRGLDRLYLTESQLISLAEKLEDTSYFSSEFLLRPSVQEFVSIMREGDADTVVAFRPSLLGADDVFMDDINGVRRVITPAVDAYVYVNNNGRYCNVVLTLARCVLETEKGNCFSSTQFVALSRSDPYSLFVINHDRRYFLEFARTIKALFLAVQMMSLDRPEILIRETVREKTVETVKQKGRYKKINRTRMVRLIRISDSDIERFEPRTHHTITCPAWGVAGHWRHCKSGVTVWVRPHRKGRERRNPLLYQPKEYVLSKEA